MKNLQEMSNEELWEIFPIVLEDYNPEWKDWYQKEQEIIINAAGKNNAARIHHIGSTSVYGLRAKPTVDILLEIKKECDLNLLISNLEEAGYMYSPQPHKPAPHMMFQKGYTPLGFEREVYHLHIRYQGDWDEIYFRDYLRIHSDAAAKYADLKDRLKKEYEHDRDGYTFAKSEFVKNITALAREEKKRNYQKELDQEIEKIKRDDKVPTLLLHSCCAPCSSYVLEYLSNYFKITVFYYNPNIYPQQEYEKRVLEQQHFIQSLPAKYPVEFCGGRYEQEEFYSGIRGLEKIREGGERCYACYEMRLRETARIAKQQGYDYFTTTLSISPLKNAVKLNEIGERLAAEIQVPYLVSDFKKKNGYKRSITLSGQYGLYRQDYCGCIFSRKERDNQ